LAAYAVAHYAQPRFTKDLDLFVKADPQNASAIFAALSEFGAPLQGATVEDFSAPQFFFQLGQPPIATDILTKVDGLDFDKAWSNRAESVIDESMGQTAYFVSREDLLASKAAAGSLQDLADAAAVQRASERRSKFEKKE
jgi:hypothetical protein